MTLVVYLIRHGETDFNKKSREWGQRDDAPLNDFGISQTKKLFHKLKNTNFNKIYSSDLIRAKQTVEGIKILTNKNIIFDERLREYNPGNVNPQSEEWIEEYKRILNLRISKYDIRPFGGENIWDLIKRVQSFLKDLEKEKGTIAIVSHSGVNAILMNLSQGRQKNEFLPIKQDNTCINILEFNKEEWKIKEINDSSHILNIPTKEICKNQKEIKERAKNYFFDELKNNIKELYFTDDIINNSFGVYDRPYKRYKGSTVEAYGILREGFKIPQKWKISILNDKLEKYEIGEIKLNEIKHKINLTIIKDSKNIENINKEKIVILSKKFKILKGKKSKYFN